MEVEDLLNAQDIKFVPKGADLLVRCLNSEHEDKNPSMRIDTVTGIFNCFSCNFKGNLFKHFGEKVNKLQLRRELFKRKIQEKRVENVGLEIPIDSVPYEGTWRNIKSETYKKFEAFQHHSNDHIGRIVFPIRSITGQITAFIGRHTTSGVPKYKVSPIKAKLPLFPFVKPINGSVILVEGIFDVLNLHDKGLTNTLCCFGTQNISSSKLSILAMQGITSIFLFYDGDEPGQKAAINVKTLCDSIDMPSTNIYLEGRDPGDLTENEVRKLWKKLYEHSNYRN